MGGDEELEKEKFQDRTHNVLVTHDPFYHCQLSHKMELVTETQDRGQGGWPLGLCLALLLNSM